METSAGIEETLPTDETAPETVTVTFQLTVDGVQRDPLEKPFAVGAPVALSEEFKSLEQDGYELTWYLDRELTKEADLEKEPVYVTEDTVLYIVAVQPVPEPVATEVPAETEAPVETEAPAETEVPVETEVPA